MRRAIWKSVDFFLVDGIRYDMDAVVIETRQEPLPIYPRFDLKRTNLMGYVSDLHIEDGDFTGEVEWLEDSVMCDEIFDALPLRMVGSYRVENTGNVVDGATLLYVTVAPIAETPGGE